MPPRALTPSLERATLARRLRALRELRWPDATLTQAALAEVIGTPLGVSTISSWESPNSTTMPSRRRLAAYATFFATRRSIEGSRPRILKEAELDEPEQAERDRLLEELLALRDGPPTPGPPARSEAGERSSWRFPDGAPVRLVCGRPPDDVCAKVDEHP